MPNTYFHFKQFTVHQDKSSMKVCTDSCLLGAWVANKMVADKWDIEKVIDIGTGTGLLSLMIAQRTKPAHITAIEIDALAAEQAAENFKSSPWSDRLHVILSDVCDLKTEEKYDLIISNPPFYDNNLKSPEVKKNLALHSTALTLPALCAKAKNIVTSDGKFAVLLPFYRTTEFEKTALQNGFYLQEKVLVKQTEKHSFSRSLLLFGTSDIQSITYELAIKVDGEYSSGFIELLKDYYLEL